MSAASSSSTPEEWSTLRNGAIVSAVVVPDNSPILEDHHFVHDDRLTAPSRSRVPLQEAGRAPIVETIPRLRLMILASGVRVSTLIMFR